ncbi:MAS20 protein import receptor-domain-containing protein [Fimicolochytrium jonesii]|uniref:MAS20 protein import receptor-domain-containing protein n=1 Tax=Fimicolochytrium jonesii TaxID=1396493 RepID=UPI0022FE7C01|nr:MAS20 protein import receptor-domain-containing protein [Fimicolochytrium jonesii]KAI8819435.1 MAS20 protein import receptor-domain-containing protein [Fimicolochytrium jonesii]
MGLNNFAITAAVVTGVAAVGYLVYFDQKRHNDPAFRRKLRKQRKAAEQAKRANAHSAPKAPKEQSFASMGGGLNLDEPIPSDPQERGEFFVKHLQMGEALVQRGPQMHVAAAKCLFRALQAYGEPMNLLMVLQQTVPEPVMSLIMEMYAAEIKKTQAEYFQNYPDPKENVQIKEVTMSTTESGKKIIRRGLTVTKDVKSGEEIFRVQPIVSHCELDDHCAHCTLPLPPTPTACPKCATARYCTPTCLSTAHDEYHGFLCPGDDTTGPAAQEFLEYCRERNVVVPVLVAKFLSRMVFEEQVKPQRDPEATRAKYTAWDHLERLFDLKLKPSDAETKEVELLQKIIAPKTPGFDEFLTPERYTVIKSKLAYNAYSIHTPSVPSLTTPLVPAEHLRTSHPPTTRTGTGLYQTPAFISHSCAPNAELVFPGADREAALVALRDVRVGEEVFVSWIEAGEERTGERRKGLKKYVSIPFVGVRRGGPDW